MPTKQIASRTAVDMSAPLEREAGQVLADVRSAFRGALEALPFPATRPRDLEQGLGIHKTLAWRILRVAHGREPLADAQHIPGPEGVEIFLTAAKSAGVPKASLQAIRDGVGRFQTLVNAHAGDRTSLEVMLRSMTEAPEPGADLRAMRRASFKCASYTWGTQTKVRVLAGIFTPRPDGLADVATVRAHIGMRLVRRDARLVLSRTVESDTDRPGPRVARVEAVEPEGLVGGVPLLRDFCTQPLPALEAVPSPNNNVDYRFAEQDVGARGAITAYTAEVRRALPGCLVRDESNTLNTLILGVRTPMESGIVDMWFPPRLFGANKPRGYTLCAMAGDPARQAPSQWRRLPMAETEQRMGRGIAAAAIDSEPDYALALQRVFSRLGLRADDYELYRLCVDFPVMGTSLALAVDLPDAAVDHP